jgi:hypothetical protein
MKTCTRNCAFRGVAHSHRSSWGSSGLQMHTATYACRQKTPRFSLNVSLCSFRACLGREIVVYIGMAQKAGFGHRYDDLICAVEHGTRVRLPASKAIKQSNLCCSSFLVCLSRACLGKSLRCPTKTKSRHGSTTPKTAVVFAHPLEERMLTCSPCATHRCAAGSNVITSDGPSACAPCQGIERLRNSFGAFSMSSSRCEDVRSHTSSSLFSSASSTRHIPWRRQTSEALREGRTLQCCCSTLLPPPRSMQPSSWSNLQPSRLLHCLL